MLGFNREPAQPPHADIALRGAEAIDDWRATHPGETLDLVGAQLAEANLSGADLSNADLSGARLDGATFSEANLREARLRDASLRGANISGADGLLASQLAGADLTRAELPGSVSVERMEEAAKLGDTAEYARMIFMWMIGGCSFIWLMLISTTQLQLLTNNGVVTLPLFEVDAPSSVFFVVGPFLLIGVYYYLHVYLQRLWDSLASLPAVFPDGEPIDRKTHGWMLLGLVRWRCKRLSGQPSMFLAQTILGVVLAWGLVPLTIYAVWQRCAIRHDWNASIMQAVACACVAYVALGSFTTAVTAFSRPRRRYLWMLRHALAVAVLYGLHGVMQQTFHGGGDSVWFNAQIDSYHPTDRTAKWGRDKRVLANNYLHLSPFVRDDFDGRRDPEYAKTKGKMDKLSERWQEVYADFGGPLLKNANLSGSRVLASDLSSADLSRSEWINAFLEEADFTQANLNFTTFHRAAMIDPVMISTQGHAADFSHASATGLIAFHSDFAGAKFVGFVATGHPADFRGAILDSADFKLALMPAARMQGAQMVKAKLAGAKLPHADLSLAKLSGADLRGADLRGVQFAGADLSGADLQGALIGEVALAYPRGSQTFGTQFKGTNLAGANLTGIQGLTAEVLEGAQLDASTRLDTHLQYLVAPLKRQLEVAEKPKEWPSIPWSPK